MNKVQYDYNNMSKEALIERILELERKLSTIPHNTSANKYKKSKKSIEFSQYAIRPIALKMAYLGFDYHGVVRQESTTETVEHYLLEALKRATLIPSSTDTLSNFNFSCSGRTDSGVSAFGQVIGIHVRSNQKLHPGSSDGAIVGLAQDKELNYTSMINAFLPKDIRVLNWETTPADFSARFDCISRTYKYFFVRDELDIPAMNVACEYFIGMHNFKNFCKATQDVENYERTVLYADISPMDVFNSQVSSFSLYVFTVKGRGFLYHQIRCMMGMLFRVGRGECSPSIIRDMLNIEKYPRKPAYDMASEIPLILWNCEYDSAKLQFSESKDHKRLLHHFKHCNHHYLMRGIVASAMTYELNIRNKN